MELLFKKHKFLVAPPRLRLRPHDYVTSSIILVRTKSRNFREFSFRQLCVGMYELAVQFRSLGESSFVPSVLLLSRHQLPVTRHGATRGR